MIPGVLYGGGDGSQAISVPERELRRVLSGSHGLHTILDIALEGQETTHPAILKEFQRDPVRGYVSHVDLMEVRLDRVIQASVAIELVGESEGVKEGGVLSQVNREVNVEALPLEVPERIELDVSGMKIGDALRVENLPVLEGVKYLDDPEETVLATVTPPTLVVEPEEELAEEEEEGVEAAAEEEPSEGAAEPAEADESGDGTEAESE
jgi:large subunit ribosomal protein L25